jgi:hypothetical protein
MFRFFVSFAVALAVAPAAASGAGASLDPVALANKADVLKEGLQGVAVTAVHEVTDTAGKTEKQVYRVLNQVSTGASFIVISSESPEVNGMVYLIKGGVLYAAAPNQRSFVRLGALNLDRRVAGSLFSHWDLQGNVPLGVEYTPVVTRTDGGKAEMELQAKSGSHYKKITGNLDLKSGLFSDMALHDDKGLLKTVTYESFRKLGAGKLQRRVPTLVTMRRADRRGDLPVPRTVFKIVEVEFDPAVNYGDELAVSDANLQRLRSRYALSGEAFRSILAESN